MGNEKLTTLARRLRPFLSAQLAALISGGAVSAGADINTIATRAGTEVSRAGDSILRFATGSVIKEYAATSAGFASALSEASAGDTIWIPSMSIGGNHTIPAGVEVIGEGNYTSVLSGLITNNGIMSGIRASGTLTNNGTLHYVIDPTGNTQTSINLGVDISPRVAVHADNVGDSRAIRISTPTGYDSTLQLYDRSGTSYNGWALMKDRVAGDLEIHRDLVEGVEDRCDLHINYADGKIIVGSDGVVASANPDREIQMNKQAPDATNRWGMNTSSVGGGTRLEIVDADAENTNDQAQVWLERQHDGAWPGSGDPSTPVNIYAQHVQTGSGTAFTHTIMALAVNEGTGDNDTVAVSGRVRKTGAGPGDAAGVWGSAYNSVNQNGGVQGVEGHIYQNIAGMVAGDTVGAKWSAAVHARSDSTGSNAFSGVLVTGNNTYRFWNGILIDVSAFTGSGAAGTVGLNMAGAYPQYGIKFGSASKHIYGTGALDIQSASGTIVLTGTSNAIAQFEDSIITLNQAVDYPEISAPASPAANTARLYAKDDGSGTTYLYYKRSDGTEIQITAAVIPALDDLSDVDTTGVGTGDIIYKSSGDWVDYPLGVGTSIVNDGASIKLGDVAGNNYLSVSTSTGEISLSGDATAFEDLRVEPNVRQAAGAGVPSFEKYFDDTAGTSKGVYLYSFTDESVAANEKEVFFTMQMPHAWKIGTDISFHVHFVPAATVASSDIVWGLEYVWKGIGEVFGDTTIIYSSTTLLPDDANITAGKHYLAEFTDISPGTTASSLSSILIGRLFRNSSSGSDTYTNKVGLLYIDAHYEVDSFGSYSEYEKSTSLTDSDGVTITDSDGVELVDSLG